MSCKCVTSKSTNENSNVISVCPQTTTIYSVIVSDQTTGCTFTSDFTVEVIDVRCGPNLDKVLVCTIEASSGGGGNGGGNGNGNGGGGDGGTNGRGGAGGAQSRKDGEQRVDLVSHYHHHLL